MTPDDTILDRQPKYGDFIETAHISQSLKFYVHRAIVKAELDDDMIEALDMICVKIARILNGNSELADHWHDIAGYARLVEARLEADSREPTLSADPPPSAKEVDFPSVWGASDSQASDVQPIRIVEDCGCGSNQCPSQETVLVDPPDSQKFNDLWAEHQAHTRHWNDVAQHGEDGGWGV